MKIYIIRHGETDLNSKGIMQGRLDEPLNKSGRELAVVTGQGMKGIRFDCCITSPLSRSKETVDIVLRESGNDVPVFTDERLLEICFGAMEGKTLPEMGDEGQLFFNDPFRFSGFENGETINDVCARTQSFFKELIAKDDGKNYLIGSHGCAVRAMLNYLYDDPSDFWRGHAPYNCSVNIIYAENGIPRIAAQDKVYYDKSLIVDHYRSKKQ